MPRKLLRSISESFEESQLDIKRLDKDSGKNVLEYIWEGSAIEHDLLNISLIDYLKNFVFVHV